MSESLEIDNKTPPTVGSKATGSPGVGGRTYKTTYHTQRCSYNANNGNSISSDTSDGISSSGSVPIGLVENDNNSISSCGSGNSNILSNKNILPSASAASKTKASAVYRDQLICTLPTQSAPTPWTNTQPQACRTSLSPPLWNATSMSLQAHTGATALYTPPAPNAP